MSFTIILFKRIATSSSLFTYTLRKLSLKCTPEMNKSGSREARFFNKLINTPTKKKRKLFFETNPTAPSGGNPSFSQDGGSSKENSRRLAVLNSVFLRHISDLLMTGNLTGDVLDKGLQISRVSMTPNFNQLNVFWATNSDENNTALEAVLPQLGFTLRHELSQLRVMGVVPRIVFVKDKQYHNALKVDHLISIADYGDDHVPLPLGSEFTNPQASEKNDKEATQESLSDGLSDSKPQALLEEEMPVMLQDIFNLDRDRIMNKILKSVRKSRALHRFQPNLALESEGLNYIPTETDAGSEMTKQQRKEAMSRFILERKILQEKRIQNKYNSELNVSYFESKENCDDDDVDEFEDFMAEDYIEEEYVDEKKFEN